MSSQKSSKSALVKIIGKKIQENREEKQWSQQHLAELLGYKSRSVVSLMETGKRPPSLKELEKLADIFGKDILCFFENGIPKSIKDWKARKYDDLEKMLTSVVKTVFNEDYFFDLLGISHPKLKEFFKSARICGKDEIKCIIDSLPLELVKEK